MARTMKLPRLLLAAPALALLAGGATPAGAQVSDHLKCYRVRDAITSVRYTADLQGLTAQPGCRIKARAKLLCVSTTKTAVSPTPPGGGPGSPGAAGKFLCYRALCPPATVSGQALSDQFGARTVSPLRPQLLCAPASPSGAFLDASTALF